VTDDIAGVYKDGVKFCELATVFMY